MLTLRRWHRLLGLFIGLPCLLWGSSGAVLAWKHWTTRRPAGAPARVAGERAPFTIPIERALQAARRADPPSAVEWRWLLGRPRYELRYDAAPELVLIDGATGQPLPPADEGLARRVAEADSPGARVLSVEQVQGYGLVFRPGPGRELPVLRVRMDSGDDVYISIATGQPVMHVDTAARVLRVAYFGLHLWDLSSGPEPHKSYYLLNIAALGLVLVGASGLWLALRPRRRLTGTGPPPPLS